MSCIRNLNRTFLILNLKNKRPFVLVLILEEIYEAVVEEEEEEEEKQKKEEGKRRQDNLTIIGRTFVGNPVPGGHPEVSPASYPKRCVDEATFTEDDEDEDEDEVDNDDQFCDLRKVISLRVA
ncbi:hypothetical protein M0802_005134 [Mischocyttarus mexicanus]|nr:hypothetical protein M0802_005134 [Mischocyttarus mexicanus]